MSQIKLRPLPFIRGLIGLLCLLCAPLAHAVIRDGGVDPENLGQGGWIYIVNTATNKLGGTVPSVTNVTSMFNYFKNQNFNFVIVKAATSNRLWTGSTTVAIGSSSAQFTTNLVTLAHNAGLKIFGSNRSYGQDIPGEVSVADYVYNCGADGYIHDAESEWESSNAWIGSNGPTLAWQLCSSIRSNWPTKFMAHNPYDTVYLHSSFPFKEFGYWCDSVMPQVYHHSASSNNAIAAIHWSDVHYQQLYTSFSNLAPSVVNGTTVYWTNAIKPLLLMRDVYNGASGTPVYPDVDVRNFNDYLVADPNAVYLPYKGSDYFRSELHSTGQWANMKASTIGDFTNYVNNIILDDNKATRVGTWNLVRTISATTGTVTFAPPGGGSTGTDTNSFGTNYWYKAQGSGTAYAEFTPTVLTAGDYNIYQWHPTRSTASTNVPFAITYYGGIVTNLINQTTNNGDWSFVGRFPFAAGTGGSIRIYDNFSEASSVALVDGLKMTFVYPVAAPAAPSGLTATAINSSQINLSWTDNSTNESGFVVARSTTSGGPYTDVATNAPNTTSYSATGLNGSTTYYFVVRGVNYKGDSANSAQASATTFVSGGVAPVIVTQPQNQSAFAGSNATFSVTATGTAPLLYQWRLNSASIAGATLSSYTRTNVQPADAGNYSVIVSNAYGAVTSTNATLTVTVIAPSITSQPQGSTNNGGTTASFSVIASGSSPLSYQWKKNGVPLSNGGNISGATSTNLTITAVSTADSADYSVTVTNSAGSVTSSNATLVVNSVPTISNQPASQTNNAGSSAIFTVTAAGSQPLAYQWKKNGTNLVNGGNISGATTSALTIASVSQTDAANYTVTVTNAFGSATSSAASLIVIDPPVITGQPASRTNNAGTLATFTVTASGTAPSYQWQKDGFPLSNAGNVSGATTATLNIASVAASDAANYSVIISNAAGKATSIVAVLTVIVPPSISSQPQNQTVSAGANVTFTVSAAGSAPLAYRWRFNGTTIAGATNSVYSKNGVATNDAGNYSVVITNAAGSVTSSNAALVVNIGETQVITISNIWNITAGSRDYVTVGNTERGIALNSVSNHVLIVSRATNANGSIIAVNATTGSDLGISLNTTGISGGTLPLNKVAVTADGIIYAANLTTTSSNSPLKIYRWGSYSETPLLAYSGAPDAGVTARWGDSLALKGTGAGTQIIVAGSASTNVVIFTTTNGTNFTPTVVNPTPAFGSGSASKGLAFGSGSSFYIKNRTFSSATNYIFNLGTGTAASNATVTSLDSNLIAIGVDTNHNLLAGIFDDNTTNTSSHLLKTYDISNPSSPSLLASFNFPSFGSNTNSANANFAGHVDTDGTKIIGLDTQNGIVAAQIIVQVSPTITTHPQDQSVPQGSNAVFTVVASGTTPFSYQWKKDGVSLTDGGNVTGATTAALTILAVSSADEADYGVTVSNPLGASDSTAGTLSVIVPPSITTSPQPQTVNAGSSANFTVSASGSAPLTYQWKKGTTSLVNGTNIFGATSSSLVIATVTQADAADYSVIISNSAGQATSSQVHLTVIDPPVITASPVTQTVAAGSTVVFSGSASGMNLNYQWLKNGISINNGGNASGATTTTLTLTGTSQSDVADYSLIVTNSAGSATTSPAHLTVIDPPAITGEPSPRTNNYNSTATFSVTTTGQNLSYQWKKNGAAMLNGGRISGATSSTLTIANVSQSDASDYSVTITNIAGAQTSGSAHLTVIDPPTITSQPSSITNNAGETAVFSVVASSSAPVTYQWQKNNSDIADALNISGTSSANLTISNVSNDDVADYKVIVSNTAGSTPSDSAHLTLTLAPSIIVQPIDQTIGIGSNVTFTVSAAGTGPISYRWKKNGAPLTDGGKISGANTAALMITGSGYADAGAYSVVITNTAGTITSDDAALLVIDKPVIVTQPAGLTNASAMTVYLSVAATGTNVAFQWQKNGVNLFDDGTEDSKVSGAASDTLAIHSTVPSDSGGYRVIVTNEAGAVTSALATVTILDPPAIVAHPVSRTNAANTTATLSAITTGSLPLKYQWRKNGVALAASAKVIGVATPTLTLSGLVLTNTGDYSLFVSNAVGSVTSSPAHLEVLSIPSIATQPSSRTNLPNSVATFTVVANGVGLTYQWKKAGVALSDNYYISGTKTATLTLNGVLAGDSGSYTVSVSNVVGGVTSLPGLLKVIVPPTITSQPQSRTNVTGTTATFSVLLSGTTPLTYRWKKDGVPLVDSPTVAGSGTATLKLIGVTSANAGDYSVEVTNYSGVAISTLASLTVVDAISIVSNPVNQTNVTGTTASFAVVASGTNPTYQWRKGTTILVDNTRVSGTTSDTLQVANVELGDAGTYSVIVSNFAGKQISANATLTVLSPPLITNQPASQLVAYGSNTSFGVRVTGTAPFTYAWLKNGTNLIDNAHIIGATSSNLTVIGAVDADEGDYSVVITNDVGTVISSNAALTIVPTVTILKPTANVMIATGTTNIMGTASDHGSVTQVLYQVNNGGFQVAAGTTTWTTPMFSLVPGTNVISVKSINSAGRESKVVTRNVFYPVVGTLTVITNGVGTITPNLPSQTLYVGRNYTITALPGSGQLFSNWTGTYNTNTKALTFRMESNVTLNANFVTNLFIPRAGTYSGLFFKTNEVTHETSGSFKFVLTSAGTYSGQFYLSGISRPMSGVFDLSGKSKFTYTGSPGVVVTLDLNTSSGLSDRVTGTVSNETWLAQLNGDRSFYNNTNLAPKAGKYLISFIGTSDGSNSPGGDGYGTVTISTNGTLSLVGSLSDGSAVSQTTFITKNGQWALYAPLYSTKGSIIGWLNFTNDPTRSIEGDVSWIKKSGTTILTYYADGFTNDLAVIGSTVSALTNGTPAFSFTTGKIILSGGDLIRPITNTITTGTNNVISVDPGQPDGLSVTLDTKTGLLTGTFFDRTTGTKLPFKGVLLQQQNNARGYYLSSPNHVTGSFLLLGD